MRFFWRNKLKSLLVFVTIVTVLVLIRRRVHDKEDVVAAKRFPKSSKFLDLPETTSGHHKIWKHIFISTYHIEESINNNGKIDVGLATQSSIYHLHNLVKLSEIWKGPISIGVFVLGSQWNLFTKTVKNLVLCNQNIAKFVTFHALIPLSHPPDEDVLKFKIDENDRCDGLSTMKSDEVAARNYEVAARNYDNAHVSYPVNALRNVAVDNLGTSHVFMIDVDMVPNMKLRQYLIEKLKMEDFKVSNAYVIPAFEVYTGSKLPESKAELLKEWQEGRVRPFYSTVCWKCQKHTDYEKWRRGREKEEEMEMSYEVPWIDPWEPFYAINRQYVHYDERFEQYGFNRISQLCDLHIKGIDFYVLYDAYLLHVGFKDVNKFHKRKDEENARNRGLYRQFKKEKIMDSVNGRRC